MKNAEKRKTNQKAEPNPRCVQTLKILPTKINYVQNKLIEYANEHNIQRPQNKGN